MYGEDVRRRVEALRWYHTIDLGQGIVTRGVHDTPLRLARLDLPLSFAGRTVLDVGAWDGFFSFEAERRGASRVVATDHYSWHGLGWGTGDGKAMAFYPARELDGDPTNWWGPNEPAVHGMLQSCGFQAVRTVTASRSAPYRLVRAVFHQLKGKKPAPLAYRQDRAAFHARKKT